MKKTRTLPAPLPAPTIAQVIADVENEHAVLIAEAKAKVRKPAKVYTHLLPREAKEIGSQRKEVRLTLPIIEKLERKAKRESIDLKKYLERVLIKVASMPDFNTAL